MQRSKAKIRVGITMGDPSGIGAQIIPKALDKVVDLADYVIIGDKWVFNQALGARCSVSGVNNRVKFIDLNNVNHKKFKFGEVKAEYGKASIEYLDKALELLKNKQIDCLVTCPVSKEAINLAGLKDFSGHTEYLAKRTKTKHFVMMLLNKKLRFCLVTRHMPLKDVALSLNCKEIREAVSFAYKSLKELFLIRRPRIAVCGLNPHASDNGILGEEENKIIKPALNRLKRIIKTIAGPLPADTTVLKAAQDKYDCVIAMYHDQALIPLKLSGDYSGVNMTLGLPFIRTSPLHGTAFDIAGKFALAKPGSLIEAVKLAVKCALNQRKT